MYEEKVAEILRDQGVEFIVSLPCDRTKDLCTVFENQFRYITILREEDGIGICSGLALSGRISLLHMQSSGLGNSLNAIMTLPDLYGLSLPILASWRGYYEEKIAAQIPFNSKIPQLLSLYNIPYTIIDLPEDLKKVGDVITDAKRKCRVHVALISPRVWEGEVPQGETVLKERCRQSNLSYHRDIPLPVMQRADAIRIIADMLTNERVVSNIGFPSKELCAASDRSENFYMLGSYTQASPIGLGMALGSSSPVMVIDGDGSLLGTAVLPVIAAEKPANLTIIALDNGVFGSTGNQCTPAADIVDLELLARSCGITDTCKVSTPEELYHAIKTESKRGARFIHVIIRPGNSQVPNIAYPPQEIRDRFIRSSRSVMQPDRC